MEKKFLGNYLSLNKLVNQSLLLSKEEMERDQSREHPRWKVMQNKRVSFQVKEN